MLNARPIVFIGLVVLISIAKSPTAIAASIEPFLGHWVGAGITENQGPGSDFGFADRDLNVTIVAVSRGFRIIWQTLSRAQPGSTGKFTLRSTTVTFVEAGRKDLFRMDPVRGPISGNAYLWAHIGDRRLVVHSLSISDAGILEHQKYTRILIADDQVQLFLPARVGRRYRPFGFGAFEDKVTGAV